MGKALFSMDPLKMRPLFNTFSIRLSAALPTLAAHLNEIELFPELYLLDWFMSLFAKPFPLDLACRVWDRFLRDGEETLFNVAIAILSINERYLMSADFSHAAQLLSNLPNGSFPSHNNLLGPLQTNGFGRRLRGVFTNS